MKKVYRGMLIIGGNILPKSYHPLGRIGRRFRYYCASKIVKNIGVGCNIEKGAELQENIKLGDYACIGVKCLVSNYTEIGEHVMMGPECLIYTRNHQFDTSEKKYVGYTEYKKVIIEDNVWIGARCIILPGVKIGKGSTIGAGSVVTKDIPPYSVAAGNPASIIKKLV